MRIFGPSWLVVVVVGDGVVVARVVGAFVAGGSAIVDAPVIVVDGAKVSCAITALVVVASSSMRAVVPTIVKELETAAAGVTAQKAAPPSAN